MSYLVDTNVWLERLLDQERSDEAGAFFGGIPSTELFITDFSFHSLCLVMIRLGKVDSLLVFVREVFGESGVTLLHLYPFDTGEILSAIRLYNLDYDDAYQYVAADKHGLTLVSFDGDFARTPRGKKSPMECLSGVR
ncbi:MAG: hypothetical protein GHCLOJNM_00980 [bacterium]|nr:hypothetical protein [bacterium]